MIPRLVDNLTQLFRKSGVRRAEELVALAQALLSGRGEASGVARARELLANYGAQTPEVRLEFLLAIGERFGADPVLLGKAIDTYRSAPGPKTASALHIAAEPRRQELIRRLNLAPGGTAELVQMREDVLRNLAAHPELGPVDSDFRHLLSSWFNRGFLLLKPVNWSTPAHILEKIMHYEAVHEIADWDKLRDRLEPGDRRCFAFFHPALADEPLIFVEVALTTKSSDAIAPLLNAERQQIQAENARTAVFYSISNCQAGLRGIAFGNFLIKQVVEELKREFPRLDGFVTLSPVPEFARWLAGERASQSSLLSSADKAELSLLDQPDWHNSREAEKTLRPLLQAAIAHYFLLAKTGSGKPIDSVARFHLNNGARLERINWLADVSVKGLAAAHGFMVNYLYDVDAIERNHEAFANDGVVMASHRVKRLLERRPAADQSAE